ncbi:hypothetical protein AURDEDRAFT_146462 [Auricularia subglabra TFB-10046 SS5]|uniref:BHLH domain-containing protein n=1 Tax=Auricularia subglabra (strain TFB-10046 / SS5) TaxID=717982 RepID=J0WWM6_AURST|nr:hypothetical protein AURDEDRAFT_146462 [Auricularia subglabra TFB-10046 SS5]
MDYNPQGQEFSLDLGSFDLSEFVNTSSHELGDLFGGNPGPSGGDSVDASEGQPSYTSTSQTQVPAPGGTLSGHSAPQTAAGQLTVQQLLGMQQNLGPAASGSSDNPLGATITPAILKERLEQHMKIQQLQQLQTQILQQQINEMLRASQGPTPTPRNHAGFQGLPTPAASTELGPTGQTDYTAMSPMLLQEMFMNSNPPASTSDQQQQQQQTTIFERMHMLHNPTMSAPAALAFTTSPPVTEYELSPLWLPAGNPIPASRGPPGASTSATKRPRRNSDVEDVGARAKRPAVRMVPTLVPSPTKKKTPPRRRAGGDGMLPSPLDVQSQMLPPPPKDISSASSMSSITSVDTPQTASVSPDIAPATPAAIMGLAPMRSGLVPPPSANEERRATRRRESKAKPPAPAPKKAAASAATPKTILPTGGTPILPPAAPGQPPLHVRKSSHKVAEQKRRDSLKISFDDLRLLLPPIPALDGEPDEPLLPGAMPPRGPPRGESDGPNRAVSKLALLRCGNEYIRELKWKMDARDDEIACLRREVARLRAGFESLGIQDTGGEPIDLERDVDAGYEEVRKARKAANAAARRAAGELDDEDDFE